jgi:hypothetical protein
MAADIAVAGSAAAVSPREAVVLTGSAAAVSPREAVALAGSVAAAVGADPKLCRLAPTSWLRFPS